MTPSNAAPLAHGTTPVQGWTSADDLHRLANRNMAFVWADGPDETTQPRFPVVIVLLSLDASGQRAIPDELVERCALAVHDSLSEDAHESTRAIARAVLCCALLPETGTSPARTGDDHG